jgi:uncharacterized protein
MLMGDDVVPFELTERDQWGGWVMARLDDGCCSALDMKTFLCTVYECRPMICRDYQVGDFDCIQERLLRTAARIESHVTYPLAKAI